MHVTPPPDRRPGRTRPLRLALATLPVLVLAGCGGSTATGTAGTTTAPGTRPPTEVRVDLTEWSVTPDRTTVPAGPVRFVIHDQGALTHELAVLKTDQAPGQLQKDAEGAAVENAPDIVFIGEVEDVTRGTSTDLPATLAPGHYVLLCNLVADGEVHYGHGMVAELTVT